MIGIKYYLSPVISNIITVREISILVDPPSIETAPKNAYADGYMV
jgi:hypothetical protein